MIPLIKKKLRGLWAVYKRSQLQKAIMIGSNPAFVFTQGLSGTGGALKSMGIDGTGKGVYTSHFIGKHSRQQYLWKEKQFVGRLPMGTTVSVWIMIRFWPNLKCAKEPVRLVTSVRDPVARELSTFVKANMRLNPKFIEANSLNTLYQNFFERSALFCGLTTNWFDEAYLGDTGIDVYQYPFNKNIGCGSFIQGNIKGFIMKAEAAKDPIKNVEIAKAMSEFMSKDIPEIHTKHKDDAENQAYYSRYREIVDNFIATDEYLDSRYNTKYMRHFYTAEEIENLRAKWKHENVI